MINSPRYAPHIYVVGGYDNATKDTNEEYDIGGNVYATRTAITVATYHGAAFTCNGKMLHTAGGWTANYIFTRSSNSWATKSAGMPVANSGSRGVSLRPDCAYVPAGYESGAYTTAMRRYVESTDTWTSRNTMAAARGNYGGSAIGTDKVYVTHGINSGSSSELTCYEYTDSTDAWATKAAASQDRYGPGQFTIGSDKLYAFGGYDGTAPSGYRTTNDEYTQSSNTWATKTAVSGTRYIATGTAVNNDYGYLHAPRTADGVFGSTIGERYSQSANSWATITSLNTARYGAGSSGATA